MSRGQRNEYTQGGGKYTQGGGKLTQGGGKLTQGGGKLTPLLYTTACAPDTKGPTDEYTCSISHQV